MGAVVAGAELVRVSVVRGSRRVDVAVATGVPVAELLPDLARTFRVSPGPVALATALGVPLSPTTGLGDQGVVDGQILTLVEESGTEEVRYDDLAEAVGDIGAQELDRWGEEHTRTAAVWVAVLAGLVAALVVPGAGPVVSTVGGLLLVAGATTAVAVADRRRCTGAWTWPVLGAAAWHVQLLGTGFSHPEVGRPWWFLGEGAALALTGVGTTWVLWGLALLLSLTHNRQWSVVPLATGALAVLGGTVATLLGVAPGEILLPLATALLLAQRWMPAVVVDVLLVPDEPGPVDPGALRAEVDTAHGLVVGAAAVVAATSLLVVPYAVGLGPWGVAWAASAALALLLRARHQTLRDHVALAVVGAAAVWAATALAVGAGARTALAPPGASVALLTCIGVAAVAVLCLAPPAARPSGTRWGWCGDQVERWAVALLVPAWLVGAGLVPGPSGWWG